MIKIKSLRSLVFNWRGGRYVCNCGDIVELPEDSLESIWLSAMVQSGEVLILEYPKVEIQAKEPAAPVERKKRKYVRRTPVNK